ncbi:hypothetical protein MMC30_005988 [Trapelia coarctata]|nr:hypothetical protein [Trapelia coarctata]
MSPAPTTLWERQSLPSGLSNIKNTVSSWDNCMSQSYCKWPVIIAIIIASCILLSLLTCLFRCLCCGAECCCACFSCCNACCPSPSRRKNRDSYRDQPKYGAPPQQYPSPSPYGAPAPAPAPVYAPSPSPQPQFATFDATPRGTGTVPANEDALPPMPSWDTAPKRKVLEEHPSDEMEMGNLSPSHEKAPMLANQAPSPVGGHGDVVGAALPYQAYGARNGGDLGSPYAGSQQGRASPRVGGSSPVYGGGAAGGQGGYGQDGRGGQGGYGQGGQSGYGGNSYSQPQQQGGYAAYAPSITSGSTRYEPSSAFGGQESGTVYHSPAQGAPIGRKPVQDSWREV